MKLPGGLLHDGRLRRDYIFSTVTGRLERGLADSGLTCNFLPEQVTAVLCSSLSRLAGQAVHEVLVRSLSAGDRLFLLLQLEALIDPSPKWITAGCHVCGDLIQFQVIAGHFPVKPAGDGYPSRLLSLSIGDVELRVPTGTDEEAIARESENEHAALMLLLSRLLSQDRGPVDTRLLTPSDIEAIDQALDAMSPHVATAVTIECPHCEIAQEIPIDCHAWLATEGTSLDREIHTLAFHYHWSEQEILQLPRPRRARYLQLIDQNLGKYRADDVIRGAQGGGW